MQYQTFSMVVLTCYNGRKSTIPNRLPASCRDSWTLWLPYQPASFPETRPLEHHRHFDARPAASRTDKPLSAATPVSGKMTKHFQTQSHAGVSSYRRIAANIRSDLNSTGDNPWWLAASSCVYLLEEKCSLPS